MTQLTRVKQNIHEHKYKSCNPKKDKDKLTAQPANRFFNARSRQLTTNVQSWFWSWNWE